MVVEHAWRTFPRRLSHHSTAVEACLRRERQTSVAGSIRTRMVGCGHQDAALGLNCDRPRGVVTGRAKQTVQISPIATLLIAQLAQSCPISTKLRRLSDALGPGRVKRRSAKCGKSLINLRKESDVRELCVVSVQVATIRSC